VCKTQNTCNRTLFLKTCRANRYYYLDVGPDSGTGRKWQIKHERERDFESCVGEELIHRYGESMACRMGYAIRKEKGRSQN
jgi:hypothetical protein